MALFGGSSFGATTNFGANTGASSNFGTTPNPMKVKTFVLLIVETWKVQWGFISFWGKFSVWVRGVVKV